MAKTVCLVTGPIVGLRSTWFLEETVAFASRLGKNLKVFNLFDEIAKQAGIRPENAYEYSDYVGGLLDGYQYQFALLREKAYLSIAMQMEKLPGTVDVIVRAPASIEWRGINVEFKDHRIIAETICPDRIVTLIDAEWKIQQRLKTEYGKHALRVIAHQNSASLERILDWLGAEVSRSEDWGEWLTHLTKKKIQHYVVGIEIPSPRNRSVYVRDVDNMVKLATEKKLTSFYASYSMTVATENIRKVINDTIWELRKYGVVIDPAAIEIGQNVDAAEEDVVFAFTVCRDLRWDVQKVDIVSAFHPYPKMPPLSTGMMDELGHARAFRKERYMVLPSGSGSPFTKDNYIPAEHLFKDTKSFFKYLQTKRHPSLKPHFARNVKAFMKWQDRRRKSRCAHK